MKVRKGDTVRRIGETPANVRRRLKNEGIHRNCFGKVRRVVARGTEADVKWISGHTCNREPVAVLEVVKRKGQKPRNVRSGK